MKALIEFDEFLLGAACSGFCHRLGTKFENVVDAEHGDGVLDLLKACDGCAADALGDRVGIAKVRMLGFESFKFAVELVELGIGNFRITGVIKLVVVRQD